MKIKDFMSTDLHIIMINRGNCLPESFPIYYYYFVFYIFFVICTNYLQIQARAHTKSAINFFCFSLLKKKCVRSEINNHVYILLRGISKISFMKSIMTLHNQQIFKVTFVAFCMDVTVNIHNSIHSFRRYFM